MRRNWNGLIIVVSMILVGLIILMIAAPQSKLYGGSKVTELTSVEFMSRVAAKEIQDGVWQETEITGKFTNGEKYVAKVPEKNDEAAKALISKINENKIPIEFPKVDNTRSGWALVASIAPVIIIFVLFYFFIMRAAQAGG